jgi:hypothetical protein
MRKTLPVFLMLAAASPAHALLDARAPDADLVERYCGGMLQQFARCCHIKSD